MDSEKIELINRLSTDLSALTTALEFINNKDNVVTIGKYYNGVAGLGYLFMNNNVEKQIMDKVLPFLTKEIEDMILDIKNQLKEL